MPENRIRPRVNGVDIDIFESVITRIRVSKRRIQIKLIALLDRVPRTILPKRRLSYTPDLMSAPGRTRYFINQYDRNVYQIANPVETFCTFTPTSVHDFSKPLNDVRILKPARGGVTYYTKRTISIRYRLVKSIFPGSVRSACKAPTCTWKEKLFYHPEIGYV